MNATAPIRPIRSFVRREGRITPGQERALGELWPQFGISLGGSPIIFERHLPNCDKRVLEIGFGDGESLLAMAKAEPKSGFIGIEVHRPGVGRLLLRLREAGINNVRLICNDAAEVIAHHIPLASLDRIQIFFPDQWHKKKHHKRRLIQTGFTSLLVERLKPGGALHIATDWEDYARTIMGIVSAEKNVFNPYGEGNFVTHNGLRPSTKYEKRGLRRGHQLFDIWVEKKGTPSVQ